MIILTKPQKAPQPSEDQIVSEEPIHRCQRGKLHRPAVPSADYCFHCTCLFFFWLKSFVTNQIELKIKTWLSKHQTSRLLHVLGHPYSSSPRYSGLEERFQKLILLASVHCDEDEVTTTMKEHLMERLPLSGVVKVARYIGLSGSGWYPTRSNMISKDPSS